MENKKPAFFYIIIILLVLLSIGAIFGGAALIFSPNGNFLGMPLSFLDNTPFNSFLIPGIILFLINGILPLIITRGLIRKCKRPWFNKINIYKNQHWSLTWAYYMGFILCLWIIFQILLIKDINFLHFIYLVWGLLLIFISQIPSLKKYYKIYD